MKEYKISGFILFVAIVVAGLIFGLNATSVEADEELNAVFPRLMEICYNNNTQCNINAVNQHGQNLADCDAQFFNDPAAHQSCYEWADQALRDAWRVCDTALMSCRLEALEAAQLNR